MPKLRILRWLASPELALTLIAMLTAMVVISGTLPQSARLSADEINAWQESWPLASYWTERLGLADVAGSAGFDALCAALLVNLAAGVAVQAARSVARFSGGPPTHVLSLAVPPQALLRLCEAGKQGECRGTAGLVGMPLFHLGIAVIMVAAFADASRRLGAHFELSEGEVLSRAEGKLLLEPGSARLEGDLGFRLRLDGLTVDIEGGHYRELLAHLSLQEAEGAPRQETLAVNHPISIGPYRLFLDKNVGQTAVFERSMPDGRQRRLLVNFIVARESWGRTVPLVRDQTLDFENNPVRFHMILTPGAEPQLQLRAERDGRVAFQGMLRRGLEADVGPYRLRFVGTTQWAGLYLTSNPALGWVFSGFVLALTGFALALLVRPRRLRLRRNNDGWLLEAWAAPDDWRFARHWRAWRNEQ